MTSPVRFLTMRLRFHSGSDCSLSISLSCRRRSSSYGAFPHVNTYLPPQIRIVKCSINTHNHSKGKKSHCIKKMHRLVTAMVCFNYPVGFPGCASSKWPISDTNITFSISTVLVVGCKCLQCFDAVGWVSGRASGP